MKKAVALTLAACAVALALAGEPSWSVRDFGTTKYGEKARLFTLVGAGKVKMEVSDYGGRVVSLWTPDKDGRLADIALGFDTVADYETTDYYISSLIGRFGNRLARGRFAVDGKAYAVEANDAEHHAALHGAARGFNAFVWKAEPFVRGTDVGLVLTRTSPDGESGFPGALACKVVYTLTADDVWRLEYEATADAATPVNLTHHIYFNLKGWAAGTALDHELKIAASKTTPVDSDLIPTGGFADVKGTPFDFLDFHEVGERINADDKVLQYGPGYDHNWCLDKPLGEFGFALALREPTSGRLMECWTDEPGIQFYAGNYLNAEWHGKGGKPVAYRGGLVFETQHYPDSPNQPAFPSAILRPGETYRSKTEYRFSTYAPEKAVPDWENPQVNSRNRLGARTYSVPLADEKDALTDALEPATPYATSLNGNWKISWAGNDALAVRDFWKVDFDDSAWAEIDVPSCLELRGYGAPGYTNTRYPHAKRWPKILDRDFGTPDYNPVASYRTRFAVPAAWRGRDVILRFEGVGSACEVWVNGRNVGYAEDSKLPSEFDITSALRDGENVLAVRVRRWCDGSYLEDQDMFRYSGIFRDVSLWAKPKDGIWDFAVRTALSDDGARGTLALEGLGGDWTATLYDARAKAVGTLGPKTGALEVADVAAWSAEKPSLYTLVIRKGDDIRMKRIGFKSQKIVGNAIVVNGRKIKFKGVNRHETSPDNGRTVTLGDMLADIALFKRYNINTVRTSHYPNHRLWYDLCDRYGIYVVAEANVEGHEPGYGKESLGQFADWDHSIVERNARHAVFYRNNPSVTIWSAGNETGHGDCFRHAIAEIHRLVPGAIVHWERGNADADVDSAMYPTPAWCVRRGELGNRTSGSLQSVACGIGCWNADQYPGKPFFLCEYAHAMGNALGNFQEYWDAFYSYDALSGGCIWDWVDQAVWRYTDRFDPKTGARERYLAYGGNCDEEPNDGPFCCNGVVAPDRAVSAKLLEVAHVHRNLVVRRTKTGAFELENRFGFTSADEFAGTWTRLEDGREVARGTFAVPAVAPLARGPLALPREALVCADGKETLLNLAFATRAATELVPAGWTVAREQIALGGTAAFVPAALPASAAGVKVTEEAETVTVLAGPTKAVFCRRSGTLRALAMNGRTVLEDPAPGLVAGPRLTCLRAFTDNDRWARNGSPWGVKRSVPSAYSTGLTQLSYHAAPLVVDGNVVRTRVEVTGAKSAGFAFAADYAFAADGSLTVSNVAEPHGRLPEALPRLGLSLRLDPALERMRWYGRGPAENYVDRKTAAFLGLWESTVTDQYEPYVRPQDNGYKCDVRWVEFLDAAGAGVRFAASEPLCVQALHYSYDDLEHARSRPGETPFWKRLEPRAEVCLNLDVRQLGLGGGSCGPVTLDEYRFDPNEKVAWTLRLEPVR